MRKSKLTTQHLWCVQSDMFAMLCPSHHVCFARASSRLPSYSQEICMLCSEEYTTVALCQAPRYWAWRQQPLLFKLISQVSHGPMVVYHGLASTYAPLGIKCSVCLFGATEPEGSHSIKLPRVRHAPPDTAWQRSFKHTICAAQTNFLTIASGLCDKAPVSISMSFCFSRTACIAAFGTRKCEVKSCQFWRNFLGSLSCLNASKLITPLIYLY